MSVGYACIALGNCDRGMRGCILKNASPERLDELVESNLQTPVQGDVLNAAQHVWGYFKKIATAKEKAGWLEIMKPYESGTIASKRLKNYLYRLAQKYDDKYPLQSYYFVL